MRVAAVIKASNVSNYFPNRYHVTIAGKSVFAQIVARLRMSRFVGEMVLATSDEDADDVLVAEATDLNVKVFRGAYEDVIGRLHGAAQAVAADVVISVPGNYPLVDAGEIDTLLEEFSAGSFLFAANEHVDGIILGMGVEICRADLLTRANDDLVSAHQRRFGMTVLKDMVEPEQILTKAYDTSRSNYRVTLAVPEDVTLIGEILSHGENPSYQDILEYLDSHPLAVRYAENNISKPGETGLEKALLFPEKMSRLASGETDVVDVSYPISIELSLTDRCNLQCVWCSDAALRNRSMADIDLVVVQRLLDDLAGNGTRGVVIEGGGEPVLHAHFEEVVDYAKNLGLSLGLITNGVAIPYAERLDCFDWVRISLDATDRESFQAAKGEDCFDQVMANLAALCRRKTVTKTVIGVGYVLTKENSSGLDELVLNLGRLGVDYFQLRPVIDHPDMLPANLHFDYLRKYSTGSFSVQVGNLQENTISGNFGLPCRCHSLSSVVTANGDVFLCGRLNKYDWFQPTGNLYNEDFKSIWEGVQRRTQAEQVLDRKFCRSWCPECRLTKYNILVDNSMQIKTRKFI